MRDGQSSFYSMDLESRSKIRSIKWGGEVALVMAHVDCMDTPRHTRLSVINDRELTPVLPQIHVRSRPENTILQSLTSLNAKPHKSEHLAHVANVKNVLPRIKRNSHPATSERSPNGHRTVIRTGRMLVS